MSTESTETIIQELSALDWPEFRKRVSEQFSIRIFKEMTKDQILSEVRKKMNDANYATVARSEAPKPGYSRIKLAKSQGKSRPKIKNINGYRCAIPRGVVVDVPTKVYLSILDEYELAQEEDLSEPENSQNRWRIVQAPKEIVQLIAQTDGPDPKPGHELLKEKKNAPYKMFVKEFGYWPTDKELKAALQNRLIAINDPKFLANTASID